MGSIIIWPDLKNVWLSIGWWFQIFTNGKMAWSHPTSMNKRFLNILKKAVCLKSCWNTSGECPDIFPDFFSKPLPLWSFYWAFLKLRNNLKRCHPKGKIIFKPLFFRCYFILREGNPVTDSPNNQVMLSLGFRFFSWTNSYSCLVDKKPPRGSLLAPFFLQRWVEVSFF